MKLVCEKCNTKYAVSDENIQGQTLEVRCRKCGNAIVVGRPPAGGSAAGRPAAVSGRARRADRGAGEERRGASTAGREEDEGRREPGAAGEPSHRDEHFEVVAPDVEWFYARKGEQYGPVPRDEIIDLLARGGLKPKSFVWAASLADWTRVRDVPDFAPYVERTSSAPEAQPSTPAIDRARPPDGHAFSQTEEPAPEEAEPRAAEDADKTDRAPLPFDTGDGGDREALIKAIRSAPRTAEVSRPTKGIARGAIPEAGIPFEEHPEEEEGVQESLEERIQKLRDVSPMEPPRESTQMILKRVVDPKIKRRRQLLGAGVGIVFLALLALFLGKLRIFDIRIFGGAKKGAEGARWEGGENDVQLVFRKAEEEGKKAVRAAKKTPRPVDDFSQAMAAAMDSGGSDKLSYKRQTASKAVEIDRNSVFGASGIESKAEKLFGANEAAAGVDFSGKKTVRGYLPDDLVKQAIDANKESIRRCYERELKRDETLRGRVDIALTVKANGTVKSVRIGKSGISGTMVEDCLSKAVRGWRFPAFEGEPTEVSFPLILRPGM